LDQGYFLHNTLLFGRLLLKLGLDIHPNSMVDVVEGVAHTGIRNKNDFYYTLRSLLVKDHKDYDIFHQAFELFWRKPTKGWQILRLPRHTSQYKIPSRPPRRRMQEIKKMPGRQISKDEEVITSVSYSPHESLRQKDFANLTDEEGKAIEQMIHKIQWTPSLKRTRRWIAGKSRVIYLRKTLRHNVRHGGELLVWKYKTPKFKPRPIVLLADVSGSMQQYSRMLLHFIYSITVGFSQPVESFLFSTQLTRITRHINNRRVEEALREVSNHVQDWLGGTRIGETLKTFNHQWAKRVSSLNALVLLISDGWDRGSPKVMEREMARLQRNCHHLIWLNPLLGSTDYQPLTRGMKSALSYIDEFIPAHNLASLEDLANLLTHSHHRIPST
jgi:uncharacterized protein with von Willebrand factor type A (vWA) domain